MTGVRWRKVRADLLSNKLRSALAILSLAVGTSAVGAMLLAGTTVETSFATSFQETNPPTAVLITDPFTPDLLGDVTDHPAVAEVDGRRLHQAQVRAPDGAAHSVQLVAMPDLTGNAVGRIAPESGTWPPAPGGLVIERASVAELDVSAGDVVHVEIPGGSIVPLTVVGTASDVYEVAPMLGGAIRGYIDLVTMAELTGSEHLNALYLRAATSTQDRAQATAMTAAVRDDVLAPAGVAIAASLVDDPAVHPANSALSFVTLAMQLLSLLGLLIAVGLVVNTVAALLAQQRRHLGVMKAIGATSGQLMTQHLSYVLLLSAAAIAVAVPVSLVVGRGVAGFIAGLANIDLAPMGLPLAAIATQVGIAVLVPVAAVLLVVRRSSRTSVREALTDRGVTTQASTKVTHVPLSRPTVLAYRNALRNRARLALTVLTVALSGAVVVGVSSTGSAMGDLADQVAGYSSYDLALHLTEPVATVEAVQALDEADTVADIEGWIAAEAFRVRPDGTENDNISLYGIPTGSAAIEPTLLDGRWYDAEDTNPIVINTHLLDEEPDLAIGESLVLDVGGHHARWHVVGIASTTLVGPVAYVPVDDLAQARDAPGQANLLTVQLQSGIDQATAAEQLGSLALDAGLPVGEVQTAAAIREGVEGLLTIVVALLLVVGVILAIVAVVGVAGTMTLSVVEQTREIGILRTVGASTWAVRRLLLLQGLAIASIGGALGIALSWGVAWSLSTAIGSTLISAHLPIGFSWLGVAAWAIAALAIGAIGAIQPSRVAARLTIRETLAYE